MLIYQDIITGDELFSDAFDVKEVGGVYEIECAMIQVKEGADVDIGANASAEEVEESLEDGVTVVNNVVYSFRLQSTSFDKKGYTSYIKGYLKQLKAAKGLSEADTKTFESEMTAEVKKVLGAFKDFEFYVGESMNPDGAVMLLNYREDGTTPYFTVFKHAVKTMKVVSGRELIAYMVCCIMHGMDDSNDCFLFSMLH
ncbi:translationally controlled tumor protein [Gamsiella multidivaricata]|uniref:translationally controlled tumor protein n=1 Tax=Gamsiella multidivaricata TaxID=101098 RepID=UPI00222037BC|nr:translationally controlled tumor protein [Gamsiella multidivaricata]KAI7822866.1 translationally controlled tumor protein [Gamsiella multidivaricata]